MQIQSSREGERNRGEEQGAEEREGGKSSEQGRALTLGAWGACREEPRSSDGKPTGPLQGGGRVPYREADGKPMGPQGGGRATGPCREEQQSRPRGALQGEAAGGGRREARRLATPEAEARRELRGSRGRQRRDWLRRPDCRAVDLLGPLLIPAPARDSFPRHSFPPAHAPRAFPRSRFPPCRAFFDRFRVV